VDPDSIDSLLKRELAAARHARGPCPSAETLSLYLLGELSAREAAEVRSHIDLCGECDLVLLRMKSFEGATDTKPLAWWQRYPAATAAGYVLALLLAYPAFLQLRTPPPAAPSPAASPAMRQVATVDLNVIRASLGEGKPPSTAIVTEHGAVLAAQVPVKPGYRYTATLQSAAATAGPVALAAPAEATGYFHLFVEPEFLRRGSSSRLTIIETNANGVRTGEFHFDFTL
jgi:hypothetical protein